MLEDDFPKSRGHFMSSTKRVHESNISFVVDELDRETEELASEPTTHFGSLSVCAVCLVTFSSTMATTSFLQKATAAACFCGSGKAASRARRAADAAGACGSHRPRNLRRTGSFTGERLRNQALYKTAHIQYAVPLCPYSRNFNRHGCATNSVTRLAHF